MFATNAPKYFWGEAVLTATYLINRMPYRVLNFDSPSQMFLKSYPYSRLLSNLPPKIFGCSVFVHISPQNRSKLDPKAIKCIFLGYSSNQKGYRCYSPSTKKFFNSMNVTFFEDQPFYYQTAIQGENYNDLEYQLY